MTTPPHAARESADLGHDGLVHWKPFKEYAESVHWNLANFSPNEIDEYYGLFLAGYAAAQASPVDIRLWCPNCFEQHVDEAKPDVCETCGLSEAEHIEGEMSDEFTPWLNPDHKSHRCNFCNHVWRPSDHPTNGVLKLETEGSNDKSAKPVAFANGKDFDDAVKIATQHLASHWHKIAEVLPETPNPWPVQVWIYVVYTVAETVHEFYQSGKFYKGEWMDDHGKLIESAFPGAKVIAWMPIPKFTPEPDEPLTNEKLAKMRPAEIAKLKWDDVKAVLEGE